ncbi:MAG: methyltransferase domain-containing protein [Planctomycetota bacterium]|nr:MAG: methyltransferase domain-containing protein [Planctomycetota bacterium]
MIDRSLNYGRASIGGFLRRIAPYENVLDLGAGHGDDLAIAQDMCPGCRRIAVENHPPYAHALRSSGIECHSLDIERDRLPFDDKSISVVIANQVLEHIKDIFWVLHEVSRVLNQGGHFIIGVPNLASLHNRVLLAIGRQPTVIKTDSGHVRGFVLPDFVAFLEACFPGGYIVKQRRGANFYPLPPILAKPAARMFPSMAWGTMLLLVKCGTYNGGFIRRPLEQGYETRFFVG